MASDLARSQSSHARMPGDADTFRFCSMTSQSRLKWRTTNLAHCHPEYQHLQLSHQSKTVHLRYLEADPTGKARQCFLNRVGRSEPPAPRIRAARVVVHELGIRCDRVAHKHPLTKGDASVHLLNHDFDNPTNSPCTSTMLSAAPAG